MAELPSETHVVLFPFMSKGHTIPLLHLSHHLLRRHPSTSVTIFTTPANRPFIQQQTSPENISIITLPFPENIPGIPTGTESTDKLPSMSLFVPFASATKLLQPLFESALQSLPTPATFIISDGFLGWTLESATKFKIPRLVFFGMSNYVTALTADVMQNRLFSGSDDTQIALPSFPWIELSKTDFEPSFIDENQTGTESEFYMEQMVASSNSFGQVVNSFYELEPKFFDHCNRKLKVKSWCVGPLNLGKPKLEPKLKPSWVEWLDRKLEEGRSVLYVAFGSQAELSAEQLGEIGRGLEESMVNFLWVVRKEEWEIDGRFLERVENRGMVVREWVDQWEILSHGSVRGFLSHCGWNSVLESICAKVPILAWPMMAEQPLNAKMVEEEIKVGLRVETKKVGLVKWERLKTKVVELMEGDIGNEVRNNVAKLGESAIKAVEQGHGSSWHTLNELICEIHHHLRG